jgi:hypothetical protein
VRSSSEGGEKMRGRCGEKQRGSPPFIGVGGSIREVARGGNGHLMAFKPLMVGGG